VVNGKYVDSLQNKRVVITDGASGIGLATAQRFANAGISVRANFIDITPE